MSHETRRAVAFISSGFLLAGAIGLGVWQISESAHFSTTASQVNQAGHTQTATTTLTESAPAESTQAQDTNAAQQNPRASQDSSAPGFDPTHTLTPQALPDAEAQASHPQGAKNSRRAQIDAADPYLPPHAVLQEDREPVVPTVVYRPRGFEGLRADLEPQVRDESDNSIVIAEPAPNALNMPRNNAQGNAPRSTTESTENSPADGTRNRNPGQNPIVPQGGLPALAEELPDLDPQPLLNETLDIAGLAQDNLPQAPQLSPNTGNQQNNEPAGNSGQANGQNGANSPETNAANEQQHEAAPQSSNPFDAALHEIEQRIHQTMNDALEGSSASGALSSSTLNSLVTPER